MSSSRLLMLGGGGDFAIFIHLLGLRGRGGNCRAPWSRANERSDSDSCEGRGANLGGWAASLRARRQHLGGLLAWVRCPWRCGVREQPRSRPGID